MLRLAKDPSKNSTMLWTISLSTSPLQKTYQIPSSLSTLLLPKFSQQPPSSHHPPDLWQVIRSKSELPPSLNHSSPVRSPRGPPTSLTHIPYFGAKYNPLVNNLPPNTIHLTFDDSFNHHVPRLPSSITHPSFGRAFNRSIRHLPRAITHLTLAPTLTSP